MLCHARMLSPTTHTLPVAPGVLGGRFGGFLLGWETFDTELFSIPPAGAARLGLLLGLACAAPVRGRGDPACDASPHCACPCAEAALMDPQQRLLLEESAGLLLPDSSARGQTAVSVGIAKLGEPVAVAAACAAAVAAGSSFVGTGRALSAAAGRLSYCYGLRGPCGAPQLPLYQLACMPAPKRLASDGPIFAKPASLPALAPAPVPAVSVDTACSSSLVGTHYARLALTGGDCAR